ncbi:RCC1/BLIP-II [Microthyrium microscopicum]|uniref:RCC1/BLIP-II n=1 Tax=Microthyrium microscopicum TaxID=703497 RepID=A0A6A6U0K1_9PEZI|nr:RCC1/BLIP-II [Microthyrium microscopicum]
MAITDLPFDIFEEILPYLAAPDFVALTSTCRGFRQNLYADSGYWKYATRAAFRVRNRPVMPNDGVLWRNLYRRLLTQTRIYMWGQATNSGNPTYVQDWEDRSDKPGIISDLQCAGWSTIFLDQHGDLYLKGRVDGMNYLEFDPETGSFRKLLFPEDLKKETAAIRQFSAGRRHILGLADDGTAWLCFASKSPAYQLPFLEPYIDSAQKTGTATGVSRVVAGWDHSSVYIRGKGIIVWPYFAPLGRDGAETERWKTIETEIVPLSDYITPRISKKSNRSIVEPEKAKSAAEDDADVGEVISHIVLEGYVVFCTDKGKAFGHKLGSYTTFRIPGVSSVTDVQGTFRSFAIFQEDGAVLTMNHDYLAICSTGANPDKKPIHIPALQNTGVIQIAFGDYHYHALHSDGRITSYGADPSSCGALGLGRARHVYTARGVWGAVSRRSPTQDSSLLPHGYYSGRSIWFDPDQRAWSEWISNRANDKDFDWTHMEWGEFSDWVEERGSDWYHCDDVDLPDDVHDDLAPYFALSVAAGGWRSGALVLVNTKLAEATTRAILKKARGAVNLREDLLTHRVTALEDTGFDHALRWLYQGTAYDLPNIRFSTGLTMREEVGVPEGQDQQPRKPTAWVPPQGNLHYDANSDSVMFGVRGFSESTATEEGRESGVASLTI